MHGDHVEERDGATRRCVFCRMRTTFHFLGMRLCDICRDQVWDFIWVSGIQAVIVLTGGLSGFYFLLEEVLLFGALVVVKHRITAPWERPPKPR